MPEVGDPRRLGSAVAVLAVAVALGAATSFLQTVLPQPVAPLANSAGSWCLVAWLLARPARSSARGALAAALALLGLVAGYYLAADLRGFGVGVPSVLTWVVAAVLVGPPLGVGAVRSRGTGGWARVVAALVLPALLAAEAAYGVARLGGSTSTAYWVGEGVVAVLLAAVPLARPSSAPGAAGTELAGHDQAAVR